MLDNLAWLQEHKDIMMVVRLVLAAILGGIVGIERGSGDRPAGFRTHILVCVGSALFMLVSMYGFDELTPAEALHEGDLGARRDSARIAAQVVSGIGFLGAGTILHEGLTIRGLTTAAASAGSMRGLLPILEKREAMVPSRWMSLFISAQVSASTPISGSSSFHAQI